MMRKKMRGGRAGNDGASEYGHPCLSWVSSRQRSGGKVAGLSQRNWVLSQETNQIHYRYPNGFCEYSNIGFHCILTAPLIPAKQMCSIPGILRDYCRASSSDPRIAVVLVEVLAFKCLVRIFRCPSRTAIVEGHYLELLFYPESQLNNSRSAWLMLFLNPLASL